MGNKVIGTTSVKLGIYETSTDSQLAGMLGDKKEFEDGRVFRLCKAGTNDLVAGILVQSIVSGANDDNLEVADDAAIGDREVTVDVVTNADHAVHALKDGYMVVCDQVSGDVGTFYKIKDNTVFTASSEGTLTLYDPLTTALVDGTNFVTICVNPYNGVIIDNNTAVLVGVPIIKVDGDAYFWALCEGIGPGTSTSAAIAAGDYLTHYQGDVLKSAETSSTLEDTIGVAVTAIEDTGDALIVKYFHMG